MLSINKLLNLTNVKKILQNAHSTYLNSQCNNKVEEKISSLINHTNQISCLNK